MTQSTELTVNIPLPAKFTKDALQAHLDEVKARTEASAVIIPLPTSCDEKPPKELKVCASLARRVASHSIKLDNFAKNTISKAQAVINETNKVRRDTRNFLEDVKLKARLPATLWEQELARLKELEQLAREKAHDEEAAYVENERYDLAKFAAELQAKQAIIDAEIEQKKADEIRKQQAAADVIRLKEEAKKAAEKELAEREAQLLRDREGHELRVKTLRIAEENRLLKQKVLEQERIEREAAEKVRLENQRLADEQEKARLATIEAERIKTAELNKNKLLLELSNFLVEKHGLDLPQAKRLVWNIEQGKVPNLRIDY